VDPVAVKAWMKAKGIAEVCALCRSGDLRVSSSLYWIAAVDPAAGGLDSGRGAKVVRIRCGHCGHALFFMAKALGIR
jgi:hypothetical protein